MPEIKIQHVVSYSSADKGHPADNLLKPEGAYKWKTTAPADKQALVVLQFEKASQIHSIDIGNEGSAFVEVLVGKSTAKSDSDYQVLLVASSFMSPADSRNGVNRNSVRMFSSDKLNKAAASEKWDRVKIVCTQPFNKTSTYGLSFVKFHSPPEPGDQQDKTQAKKLGAFTLKEEEDDKISAGSVFHRKKDVDEEKSTNSTPSKFAASSVRAASKAIQESSSSYPSLPSTSKTDRATKDDEPKAQSMAESRAKRKHHVSDDEDSEEEKPSLKRKSTSLSTTSSKEHSPPPKMKKMKSEPPKESPAKEFKSLMKKVVFVLSGFQNPFRGELRDMAMDMGAKYKGDWDKTCTHLICAFPNTPKYNQVKGKGRIVKKDWIQQCHKQKKLLPWRKYKLGDADFSSEEEEEEETPEKKPGKPHKTLVSDDDEKPSTSKQASKPIDYGGDTDSGEDTEDEINRIQNKTNTPNSKQKHSEEQLDDPYGNSTDEDEPKAGPSHMDNSDNDSGLPELPDFFSDKNFYLYGDFPVAERRLLNRFITAYNGDIEDYMGDKVNFVVTNSPWDDNFDEALSENPQLVFVKPKWIYKCHEKDKYVPHQPHVVVPS